MAVGNITGLSKILPEITLTDDTINEVVNRISDKMGLRLQVPFSFGNGAGQINKAFYDSFVFNLATPQTHVLTDGSLKDIFGGDFDPNAMKYMVISHNKNSLASGVTVTGTFIATVYAALLASLPPGAQAILVRPSDGWPIGGGETVIVTNDDGAQDATVDFIYLGSA